MAERGRADSARVGDAALLFPFLVTGTEPTSHSAIQPAPSAGLPRSERRSAASGPGHSARDRSRGWVGRRGRRRDGSRQAALEAAVRGWGTTSVASGRPAGLAWTWHRCTCRTKRLVEAMALVDEVRSIGDRSGSRPLTDRATEILRAARARHPADEPWRPLTAREFAVAKFVASGSTNAESLPSSTSPRKPPVPTSSTSSPSSAPRAERRS